MGHKDNLVRKNINNQGYIYSGAQLIDISILDQIDGKIFSFNKIWD